MIRIFPPLLLALLLAGCAHETAAPNRYQQPAARTQPGQGAVAELQQQARSALERGAYAQARDYLQRAIRIEPRNPFSWHYLALSYRQGGDYARCFEMAERSFSYSQRSDGLDAANLQLIQACQGD